MAIPYNAYDADAENVYISVERDAIGGVSRIVITDDGVGVAYSDHLRAFGRLGDSQKKTQRVSGKGRKLRGRHGQGRYRAFALGDSVKWTVRHDNGGTIEEYVVDGSKHRSLPFGIEKEPTRVTGTQSGVTVVVDAINKPMPSLLNASHMATELSKRLALSLVQHQVNIRYDGEPVNPSQHITRKTKITFNLNDTNGDVQSVDMTVLEWDGIQSRCVYLCDADGFAQHEWDKFDVPSGKSFSFTAHVESLWIDRLVSSGTFALGTLRDDALRVKTAVQEQLNDHFRARLAEQAKGLVHDWREQGIYPYDATHLGVLHDVSRQVFDVCARTVHDMLPRFQDSSRQNRKMVFMLLKQAIEQKPDDVMAILEQVLTLTPEQQKDLASLLKSTTLGAVIGASTVVLNRLRFLAATEHLFFGPNAGDLNEPRHLQEILFKEHWIFGEVYTYPRKEVYLKEALREHCKASGREYDIETGTIYDTVEGKSRRLDIMISSTYSGITDSEVKHLVVELKRASVELKAKQLLQILSYADTVCNDHRFDKSFTKWEWLLVSERVDNFVQGQRSQVGRPMGIVHQSESCVVWVKTWGEILADIRRRYMFFLKSLETEITTGEVRP